jgi:hypothetical protein
MKEKVPYIEVASLSSKTTLKQHTFAHRRAALILRLLGTASLATAHVHRHTHKECPGPHGDVYGQVQVRPSNTLNPKSIANVARRCFQGYWRQLSGLIKECLM